MGCEVRTFGKPGELNDQHYLDVKNHAWKVSKADWVIVCDADEILFEPNMNFILKSEMMHGSTIIKTKGWGIYSESMPLNDFLEVQTCVEDKNYSKSVIFNPAKIKEIGYIFGCHECRPAGVVNYSKETIHLLHYKYIGGIDRVLNRHRNYKSRLSEINKRWNLGHTYSQPEEEQIAWYKKCLESSKTLSEHGIL